MNATCDNAWEDGKCLYKLSEMAKPICGMPHACFWTKNFVIHLLFGCRMHEKKDLVDTSQLQLNSLWNALTSTKLTTCAKEEEKGVLQSPSLFQCRKQRKWNISVFCFVLFLNGDSKRRLIRPTIHWCFTGMRNWSPSQLKIA